MTPHAEPPQQTHSVIRDVVPAEPTEGRPAKRVKTGFDDQRAARSSKDNDGTLARRHPLGIKPSGNALTSPINAKDSVGFFARLPDELLLQLLETLNVAHLLRLGSGCRALHAFTRSEELWRTLFIESPPSSFQWCGSWRSTYLAQPQSNEPRVNCSHLFSDALHRPYFCAHIPLNLYSESIPEENEIARLDDLSQEEFAAEWYSKPFILTQPIKEWPVYKQWTSQSLLEEYADVKFRAEAVDWPLRKYMDYMNNSHDESPLYLFDRGFAEKMNLIVTSEPSPEADYWPPTCFGQDAFSVLGEQRPDHRWLIVGPERSGSTFHKDPNATSAWNAVITGSKYWIMFPSSSSLPPPPGVYVSADQSEVTSPLSIAEWLLGFHAEARSTPGCKEGICHAGEVLHVPSGWYHLVLNLEPSIAITQNFIPRRRVGAVLQFLRDQKQSISGFGNDVEDPYQLFVERLKNADATLLEEGMAELERLSKGGRGKWEQLTKGGAQDDEEEEGGGFSFGFGGGDEEDEVP